MSEQCGRCGTSSGQLRRCTGCFAVRYCSRDCQKLDWSRHKASCRQRSATSSCTSVVDSTAGQAGSMAQVCRQCGKQGDKLRRCTGCLTTRYCSRDCQKLDWPRHRAACTKSPASAASTSQAMTSQQKRSLPNDKPADREGGAERPSDKEQGRGDATTDTKLRNGTDTHREPTASDEIQSKKARRENPASDMTSSATARNGFAESPPSNDTRGRFQADDVVAGRPSEGAEHRQRQNQDPGGRSADTSDDDGGRPVPIQRPAEGLASRPYYDEEIGEYDEAVSTSDMQPQSNSEDDDDSADEDQSFQRPAEPGEQDLHRANNVDRGGDGGCDNGDMDYQEQGKDQTAPQSAGGDSPPGGTRVEEYEATTVEYRADQRRGQAGQWAGQRGGQAGQSAVSGQAERGQSGARGAKEIQIDVDYGNPAGETLAQARPAAPTDDGVPVLCKTCKTKTVASNTCSRCLEVTYCSRECQRLDWVVHKTTCTAIDVLTTKGFRQLEDREFEAREAERLNSSGTTPLTSESPYIVPRVTWPEARSRASRLFPWHRVIDNFDDLERDLVGMPFAPFLPWLGREGVVAIGRLTTPYFHPFRHAWSVQDITGKNLYVIFYHDAFPFPYFRYNQLKQHNFICIQNALIHSFADGTVGFRIDDPSVVRILEPSF